MWLEMKRDTKRAHLNTNFAFQEHVLLQNKRIASAFEAIRCQSQIDKGTILFYNGHNVYLLIPNLMDFTVIVSGAIV